MYYAFSVSLVLYWRTTATAYGYRYLYPLVPLGIFGTALWLDKTRTALGRPGRKGVFHGALAVIVFGLCIYSMLSQVFTETTEALTPKRQMNTYGVVHERSYRGVSYALAGEILKPRTWVSLAANRFPGFMGSAVVLHSPIRRHVPQEVVEKVDRAYGAVGSQAYVQAFLLFLLWLSAGACFYWVQRRREPED
ncbi:MAG: hypothetical protein JRK53_25810 [Deltaproteobacteria bacterium]|nr:hypothetical protein [Deltaproteobacteria bacterium]